MNGHLHYKEVIPTLLWKPNIGVCQRILEMCKLYPDVNNYGMLRFSSCHGLHLHPPKSMMVPQPWPWPWPTVSSLSNYSVRSSSRPEKTEDLSPRCSKNTGLSLIQSPWGTLETMMEEPMVRATTVNSSEGCQTYQQRRLPSFSPCSFKKYELYDLSRQYLVKIPCHFLVFYSRFWKVRSFSNWTSEGTEHSLSED